MGFRIYFRSPIFGVVLSSYVFEKLCTCHHLRCCRITCCRENSPNSFQVSYSTIIFYGLTLRLSSPSPNSPSFAAKLILSREFEQLCVVNYDAIGLSGVNRFLQFFFSVSCHKVMIALYGHGELKYFRRTRHAYCLK